MEKRLNFQGKLDFSQIDLTAPNKVISEVGMQLSDETNGIVCATVKPYDGHIFSYTTQAFSALSEVLSTKSKKVDIQDDLGKQGEEEHKYEFYLHTPSHTNYKYRLFFMSHGIANYPVTIVLEDSIADDIFANNGRYIVSCNTREELEDLVISILQSKRILNIMQELIWIAQVQEQKKQETEEKVEELINLMAKNQNM